MKLLGIFMLLAVVVSVTAAAIAQPQETNRVRYQAVGPIDAQPVRQPAARKVLPPLELPNIAAMTEALRHVSRSTLSRQLASSQRVIRFWTHHRWLLAPQHKKCAEVPWQRTCTVARASLSLHEALAKVAETRLTRELPLINDWRTAVHYVQRIYPGTESWMLAISDREGGWGPWVWYGGGHWRGYHIGNDFLGADTVGGWMQFRYSTFAPYWRATEADLRRRGFIIPDIPMPPEGGPKMYAAWLSPLGQALTAGYMRYTGKDGCHWCL